MGKAALSRIQATWTAWVPEHMRGWLALGAALAFVIASTLIWHTRAADDPWWNTNWLNRKMITFDNSASAANLGGFPVRVSLDSSNIDYSKTRDAGQDIRFVDANGSTSLPHEIETWNESGTSEVWVRVPTIDAGSTTDYIYMYYNNSSAADNQNPGGTWSNNYSGVWHMSEDPSGAGPQIKDSSSQNAHGTSNGSMTSADSVTAPVGKGLSFDGSNDFISVPHNDLHNLNGSWTIGTWIKVGAGGSGYKKFAGKGYSWQDSSRWVLQTYYSNMSMSYQRNGNDRWTGSNALSTSEFVRIDITYNSNTSNLRIYKNGALANNFTSVTYPTITNTLELTIGQGDVAYMPVTLDEFRIANAVRNADWIAAQYKSMTGNFLTFGTEEVGIVTTLTQAAYKWFGNVDSLNAGSAFANENTKATLICSVEPVRLRLGVQAANGNYTVGSGAFKLQTATSTDGPWTDVGTLQGGSGDWWNASWTARRTITFDNSASSENLTGFPVRVSLSSSNIDYGKTQNAGQDIRFVDSNGTTVLDHEIETWNEAGTSEVWVRVPQVDAGSTTDHIYMYYGNGSAADGQDAAGVWDSNYVGVWHMGESGTALADSTANNNDGTKNTSTSPSSAAGTIGQAQYFDGNDWAKVDDSASIDSIAGGMTMQAIGRWDSGVTSADEVMIGRELANDHVEVWRLGHSDSGGNASRAYIHNGVASGMTSGASATSGTIRNYAFTYDSSNMRLYENGSLQSTTAKSGDILSSNNPITFGAEQNAGSAGPYSEFWTGTLDEIRISNVARSADWLEADNKSMMNTFATFGSEEQYSGGSEAEGWQFYDNTASTDGATVNNTVLSGSTSRQSYVESNPTPVNPNAIISGGSGEWDFALDPSSAPQGTHYFRLTKSDGSPLDGYAVYPSVEVTNKIPPNLRMRHAKFFNNGSQHNYGC